MAKKIQIVGSALTVTDTVSGLIILSQPSRDIWYKESDLQNLQRISFYDANGIKGSGVYTKEIPVISLSEAIDENDIAFNEITFREFATNFLGRKSFLGSGGIESLGWAQYKDTQYTSGAPLVVNAGASVSVGNNAGEVISDHLPNGVAQLYDGTTGKILPVKLGDALVMRVNFKAFTDNNNGLASLCLDIGATEPILEDDFQFPRGTGSGNVRSFSTTHLIYELNTFVSNGGDLKIEGVRGTTTIYDIKYVLSVINKGK